MVQTPTAIDLFAGAGGATQGLADAGFEVLAAVENDEDAAASLSLNGTAHLIDNRDIRSVCPKQLRLDVGLAPGDLSVLTACPPCQGFSSLGTTKRLDMRNNLVFQLPRFASEFKPQAIIMENVKGLATNHRFETLLYRLLKLGYQPRHFTLDAASFGVPQRRQRLILLALRGDTAPPSLPSLRGHLPSDFGPTEIDASTAILEAGPIQGTRDPLHCHRRHTPEVEARLAAIPIGGGRHDLPASLHLACHKRLRSGGATSVYGRIPLTGPAPTMTTRCTTPSCGRFVHPTENRGLTLREAALIQTFPLRYQFHGSYGSVERQIGNAVPVKLAQALGLMILPFLKHAARPSETT